MGHAVAVGLAERICRAVDQLLRAVLIRINTGRSLGSVEILDVRGVVQFGATDLCAWGSS